jgi:predicted lipid-binding transport protein (Tim44 family)
MHNAASEGAARAASHMMGPMGPGAGMAAGGLLATTGYLAGRGAFGGLLRSPLVMFAAGVAAGYFLHKYQKDIVAALAKASDASKDFILHQKESLEDMLAEAKEGEEHEAKGETP